MKIIRSDSLQFVPASHEDPKDPGVLKKVLQKKEDIAPGQVLMINWSRLPKGKSFQAHFHEDMDEIFIHISGEAVLTVDEKEIEMKKGDCVVAEKGETHTMKNTGDTDVEFIVVGVRNSAKNSENK